MTEKNISDFDFDIVDPDAAEQSVPTYPIAQWYNGQQALKPMGGVQYTGGVILPAKYLTGGLIPDGWTTGEVTFRSGKEETVVTTQKIVFAPIRTRFRWFVKQGDETIYHPRNAYSPAVNMRGHLQVLSAVHGADEPIVITFKGKASQAFESLIKDFDIKVMSVANHKAPKGKPLPRYAFWMTIVPGPHSKAGNAGRESLITPPTLVLPDIITREYLLSCYAGRENLERAQEWYRQADTWASAWDADTEPEEIYA